MVRASPSRLRRSLYAEALHEGHFLGDAAGMPVMARRQIMDMHVVRAVGAEDVRGPQLVFGRQRAYPQEQSAAIELCLQLVGVPMPEKLRQGGADETPAAADHRSGDQRRCHRSA